MHSRVPIGQYLLDAGRIEPDQLASALIRQRRQGGRLGEALVALGFLSERILLYELARKHGVLFIELGDRTVPQEILRLLPEKLIRTRRVLPLAIGHHGRRKTITVATADPQNLAILDEISFATGMVVRPVLVADRDLDRAIERNLGSPQSMNYG